MPTLQELLAQKAELDRQIAEGKPEAIKAVRAFMETLGVTVADLSPERPRVSKRAVKYKDDAGHTWTGVGQRPRWVVAALLAGQTLESFRVKT